ncbi:MAG TPA: PD-(D/E)XK nuclease family protein, partial [Burkholderiaceae bacterium]|nr:PD-(D/E)XK nuclease family protein [Burkholderiaceae bacterium]
MDEIAKSHDAAEDSSLYRIQHPPTWLERERGLIARIAAALHELRAHPARSVVLLPYAQLMPLASRMWAQARPDGFAPRFETTMNWTRSLGPWTAQPDDVRLDAALDGLTAQTLLESAGLRAHSEALAGRLVEAAHQLAPLVAAVPPAQRPDWAAQVRPAIGLGLEAPALALENAVARIALEWAVASAYPADRLWQFLQASSDEGLAPLDALVVLEGFQAEPLTEALKAHLGARAVSIPLPDANSRGRLALHAAGDAEDEAECAAACVLRHLQAGAQPVALAATDRALTRRVRAMLGARGIAIRDETGWKLSTTRAAAQLMGALRACAWNASSDAVLDWLKNAPAFDAAAVQALEKSLRKAGVAQWSSWVAPESGAGADLGSLAARVQPLRDKLQAARTLPAWLQSLRELLQACGQWDPMAADAAGQKVLEALHLHEDTQAALAQSLAASAWGARRMPATAFVAWVNQALEAASFVPEYPLEEQVVILPLSQLLARPFAALVLPGCDELRLSPAPEPPGAWTSEQRRVLGLASREVLALAARAAWEAALQLPAVDVLWRQSDEGGEPLLPSPLVQALLLAGQAPAGADPRAMRSLAQQPTPRPLPRASELPVRRLSSSAYEDLRRCPYRFFALRQLGLQEFEELETEVDKRDFGLWLHAVLKEFQEALQAKPVPDRIGRAEMLDVAAAQAARAMGLADDEFLPFAAAWPLVRDGYLDWLASHEATGAQFEEAERWLEQPLGAVTLIGQIDRIDRLPDGSALLIDYKTENQSKTRERIQQAGE